MGASQYLLITLAFTISLSSSLPTSPPHTVFTGPYPYFPDQKTVEQIANVQDGALRNLAIIQGYHDFARALVPFIAGNAGTEEATWPAYAAWASVSVGFGVRNETIYSIIDLRIKPKYPLIAAALKRFPYMRVELYRQLMTHCSTNLALGNQIVWQQVGTAMTGLLTLFGNSSTPNHALLEDFIATFQPAPSPAGEYQLGLAVRAYFAARYESDGVVRSQLVALGNALVGWDEQAKLQTALEGVFAPLVFTLPKLMGGETITIPMEGILTEMFTYDLPNEFLLVDKDMVRPPNATSDFPANLQTITNKDLLAAYANFEAKMDTLNGTAAYDWLSLPQRMRYVLALMRTRQMDKTLWHCNPFDKEQTEAIHKIQYPKNMVFCVGNCECDY